MRDINPTFTRRIVLEIKLKQRVIGIVVLGALAVIFIPLLFKGYNQANNQPNIIQQIPTPPAPPVSPDNTQAVKTQNTTTANSSPSGVITSKNQVVAADNPPPPATAPQATSAVANTAATSTPKVNSAQVNKLNALNNGLNPMASVPSSRSKTSSKKTSTVTAAKSTSNSNNSVASKSTVNPSSSAGNYAIQVGTFSNAKNASNLVQQLRSHNLPAYATQVTTSKGKMTRVLVGPLKDQATATKTLAQLKKFNITGNVISPGTNQSTIATKSSKKPVTQIVSNKGSN